MCQHKTEVYSRVVGYYRPVQQWNKGKQAEYKDRVTFKVAGKAFGNVGAVEQAPEKSVKTA
ncbi:MAG: anaerobic ribonucleoside-triphosphate reductase [Candidatus Lernaella stagnicola]|nr:anaerobic ribonucleoside-triphosphate reductase [Candidatus Lernaella stagnicola]